MSNGGWDITTSGFELQTYAILEFCFWFRSRPVRRNLHVILHAQVNEFRPNTKPELVFSGRSRHIGKWIWRHISTVGDPIWTKFGRMMHNNMHITANWSRSKSKVKFQYGRRLYFETGSSYVMSAASWDISTKFGLLIDFNLLKAVTSTDTKPEVVFNRRGRHLDKAIWRHISDLDKILQADAE